MLSQTIALCMQMRLFSRPTELLHLRRGIYRLRLDIVRQCVAIGMSPFLMNSCACLVVLLVNRRLLDYGGDMAIGAYGIVNRVVFLFITVVFGLVQGMQPIVGYNWGARKDHRAWAVLCLTIAWATLVTVSAMIIGEFFPASVIHIFGAGEELTKKAVRAYRIIVSMFPLVGAQMVMGNFFQSIGHAAKSIFLSVTRQLLFLVPSLALLPHWWGLDSVWLSMPLSDSVSFFTACGMMWYLVIRLRKKHATEGAN